VSVRTLLNWKRAARVGASIPPGRPAHSKAVRRSALWNVARAWRRIGRSHGWRKVSEILGAAVPVRLVQEQLRCLKARARRRQRVRIERARVSVEVLARDAMWSLDATHLGRSGARSVQGEVLKEACTTKLLSVTLGAHSKAEDVVELLDRARFQRECTPWVLCVDGGYSSSALEQWCAEHGTVLMVNEPRTPQHNARAECGIGELKRESGLGRGSKLEPLECGRLELTDASAQRVGRDDDPPQVPIHTRDPGVSCTNVCSRLPEWCRRLANAVLRINHRAPRATRDYLTPVELDRIRPRADDLASRESFLAAAREQLAHAVLDAKTLRARRRAERAVIHALLEEHGLIRRTRGGVPFAAAKAEGSA